MRANNFASAEPANPVYTHKRICNINGILRLKLPYFLFVLQKVNTLRLDKQNMYPNGGVFNSKI
jgi:hypothetical protein